MLCQFCGQQIVGGFRIVHTVVGKVYIGRGIDEIIAQIGSQDHAVQVFPAAGGVVTACVVGNGPFDVGVFFAQIQIQAQALDDLVIPLTDTGKNFGDVFPSCGYVVAFIQHIGDFGVSAETLAGGGRNHETAAFLGGDDVFYFLKLFSAGQRAAAELYNFDLSFQLLYPHLLWNGYTLQYYNYMEKSMECQWKHSTEMDGIFIRKPGVSHKFPGSIPADLLSFLGKPTGGREKSA